ncbi:MAG: leucine-rich repeat domain-containing protein [Clostridia bacterium]|nr:leucine-rich repeat domain-containing protein [Clostridia bacterium]
MKKITSVLLLLCLLLLPVSVAAETVDQVDYVTYELVGDTYVVKTCVKTYFGKLVIPAEHEGKPVTAIADTAFFGCQSLSAVEIAEGITSIGNQAFQGCTNLSEVNIPASVTSIGFDAFHDTAYYNNSKSWDNFLLYIDGCLVAAQGNNLAGSVVINEGTRLIADYTFFRNKFTAVSIPASVTVVGKNAFAECAKLTDVYYGGKQADWEAVAIADGNDVLSKAKKSYEKVLEKPDPQGAPDKGNTTPPPTTDKKKDLWLWVSIISGAVAVVTFVLMFLPKKKEQEPAADEETPDEQSDAAKPAEKKKK